jgi:hypothetical protein
LIRFSVCCLTDEKLISSAAIAAGSQLVLGDARRVKV